MIRRRGKGNKLLYLLYKKLNVNTNSSNKSLYVALVFAAFFALMIILQILSVENSSNNSTYNLEDTGILGRFRLFSKKNEEKEIIFPPKIAQELERMIEEAEYGADSLDSVLKESNQSIINDFYSEFEVKDHWQEVKNSKHKFYVFSAYYDDRNPENHFIRIIAATKTRTEEKVFCKLWYAHTYPPTIVNGINKLIRENWNLKYSAYFILCPLIDNLPVPDAVSILIVESNGVKNGNKLPSNNLIVHNNLKSRSRVIKNNLDITNIAVCVKPLHYDYEKVLNLIEWVELNRILGVSHFILYNHTVGPNVNCVLREYIDMGLITMLPWNLNMISQKEIRTEGLFAALNDCLYRTMYRFKYVLMIDIDELIIPYKHQNLLSMLKALNQINTDRTGAYSFRNAFFYSQWPNDNSIENNIPYPLTTLLKTRRKTELNIHKQRSKCIVIPEMIQEMGNHFVWEFSPTKSMVNVDPRIANLHHYRVCEFGGDDCVKSSSTIDRRIHFWKEDLIDSIKERINNMSKHCNIDI